MSHELLAVDPLSLLLSPSVYIRLTLPDPPPIEVLTSQFRELVRNMDVAERRQASSRAKALGVYADALQKALSKAE
ncbi:MAG: hypothetical protein JOZ54_10955 [Acidobacteria bacterium]|nr:hypothetical protein [Acidobacteriota bacterium]